MDYGVIPWGGQKAVTYPYMSPCDIPILPSGPQLVFFYVYQYIFFNRSTAAAQRRIWLLTRNGPSAHSPSTIHSISSTVSLTMTHAFHTIHGGGASPLRPQSMTYPFQLDSRYPLERWLKPIIRRDRRDMTKAVVLPPSHAGGKHRIGAPAQWCASIVDSTGLVYEYRTGFTSVSSAWAWTREHIRQYIERDKRLLMSYIDVETYMKAARKHSDMSLPFSSVTVAQSFRRRCYLWRDKLRREAMVGIPSNHPMYGRTEYDNIIIRLSGLNLIFTRVDMSLVAYDSAGNVIDLDEFAPAMSKEDTIKYNMPDFDPELAKEALAKAMEEPVATYGSERQETISAADLDPDKVDDII